MGKRARTTEAFASGRKLLHACSGRSLDRLLSVLQDDPSVVAMSRAKRMDVDSQLFDHMVHVVDVPLEDGTVFQWEILHPGRLLSALVRDCPALQDMIGEAANRREPTESCPWSLVIGFDEFVPGNKAALHNWRKCMVLSFSFLELDHNLMKDDVWMTPVCVRACMMAKAVGGWARMFRDYLRIQLLGEEGITTAGVPLIIHGEPMMLFARLKHVLSDGDGLRMAFDWKGASGLKPCFLCWNVFSKLSDLAFRRPEYVDITCTDCSLFLKNTDEDIAVAQEIVAEAQERWEEGLMTLTRLENITKTQGLNANREGVIAAEDLRGAFSITAVFTNDWVHSSLCDGFFSVEAFLLIQACVRIGISWNDFKMFLREDWKFPKDRRHQMKNAWKVFAEERNHDESRKLKCDASELLNVYGMMRHFVDTRIGSEEAVSAEVASFRAACKVIDLILMAKRGLLSMAEAKHRV